MGIRYCVIDTEGNGLFDFKQPADAPGQPRLAELGMLLLKEDLSIEEEWRGLVKPDGWTMQPEATAVNGLTTEYLLEHGKPIAEVLAIYQQAIREGYAMVAWNAQHDLKQMRAELRRAAMDDLFTQTKNVCVMRKSQGVIPRPDGKKSWPKLEHARAFLKLPDTGAHTAGADAASALAVLRYLHAQGVDLTPEVHFAREPKATVIGVDPGEAGGDRHIEATVEDGKITSVKVSRPRSAALPPRDTPLADQEIPE